jgi:trk system potassium uptake protein TrkA
MNIILIGEGKLPYFLCRNLLAKGHTVSVINRDPVSGTELAGQLSVPVIIGDGSDPRLLGDAGAAGADVLLALLPGDQDNFSACQIGKLRFSIPRVVAHVGDPDWEPLFTSMGIVTFSTLSLISGMVTQKALLSDITQTHLMVDGKVLFSEIFLESFAPSVGKTLSELGLPKNALITAVVRHGDPVVPRGDTILEKGDQVILMALPNCYGTAVRLLTGEQQV